MLRRYLLLFVTFFGVLFYTSIHTVIHRYSSQMESSERIAAQSKRGVLLTDRTGKPFFAFYGAQNSEYIPSGKIPAVVKQAVVSVEDKEFYTHPGFSIKGMARSALYNMRLKTFQYGGSTITQQLVKNVFLSPQKSLIRKYKEVILAYELDKRYSKDEILEMYLNTAYFGNGAIGIDEASRVYFNKEPDQLTLPEAAYLAGILAAPEYYGKHSENGMSKLGKQRFDYALTQLVDSGDLTHQDAEKIAAQPLKFETGSNNLNREAPHFALLVREELKQKYGEEKLEKSGMIVTTTIDLEAQSYAEEVLSNQVKNLKSQNVSNGAAVVLDADRSEVLVMVGSSDWYNEYFGKVNMATIPRHPGSSFKPIVYALAMEKGFITPATTLLDKPTTFAQNYKPQNYDKRFRGTVTVRRALANSLNVPAVSVMQKVGVEDVLDYSSNLGISTLTTASDYGPSLVLGTGSVSPLEMTNVYATFADNGMYHSPIVIQSIHDKYGKEIYTPKQLSYQAIDPNVSYITTSILSDKNTRREVFGSTLDVPVPAAVKTGTSDSYRDSWTLGYTPKVAVGVWVGNNNNKPMARVAGSLGAAPIWKNLITYFSKQGPIENFEKPEDVVAVQVCSYSGYPVKGASTGASVKTEYFIKGNVPPARPCYPPKPKDEKKDEDKKEEKHEDQRPPEIAHATEDMKQSFEEARKKIEEQTGQPVTIPENIGAPQL